MNFFRHWVLWPLFRAADAAAKWYRAERVAYNRNDIGKKMRANLRARREEESRQEIRVFLRDANDPSVYDAALAQAVARDAKEVRRCLGR